MMSVSRRRSSGLSCAPRPAVVGSIQEPGPALRKPMGGRRRRMVGPPDQQLISSHCDHGDGALSSSAGPNHGRSYRCSGRNAQRSRRRKGLRVVGVWKPPKARRGRPNRPHNDLDNDDVTHLGRTTYRRPRSGASSGNRTSYCSRSRRRCVGRIRMRVRTDLSAIARGTWIHVGMPGMGGRTSGDDL